MAGPVTGEHRHTELRVTVRLLGQRHLDRTAEHLVTQRQQDGRTN